MLATALTGCFTTWGFAGQLPGVSRDVGVALRRLHRRRRGRRAPRARASLLREARCHAALLPGSRRPTVHQRPLSRLCCASRACVVGASGACRALSQPRLKEQHDFRLLLLLSSSSLLLLLLLSLSLSSSLLLLSLLLSLLFVFVSRRRCRRRCRCHCGWRCLCVFSTPSLTAADGCATQINHYTSQAVRRTDAHAFSVGGGDGLSHARPHATTARDASILFAGVWCCHCHDTVHLHLSRFHPSSVAGLLPPCRATPCCAFM
jgi:hypothetical protein